MIFFVEMTIKSDKLKKIKNHFSIFLTSSDWQSQKIKNKNGSTYTEHGGKNIFKKKSPIFYFCVNKTEF